MSADAASGRPAGATFAERLLGWHALHGRHDLPWQHPRSAWRVWVSEIMLQQTQVTTVIGYFDRFMARFPTPQALADAAADDVLALWAGLGYYSRARNLHAAARQVRDQHGGIIPGDYEGLLELPGIGPSTAAAICAQAYGQRHAILDANVKRVLARHAGVTGWPGQTRIARRLQQEADARLPEAQLADYTQAIMDLGASVCAPRRPQCPLCPVREDCRARIEDKAETLPTPRPRRDKPERRARLLLIRDPAEGRLWLERRPPSGIWGGLWAPPILEDFDRAALVQRGVELMACEAPATLSHSFTHFTWHLEPVYCVPMAQQPYAIREHDGQWHTMRDALQRGLPAPIRRLFERLEEPDP